MLTFSSITAMTSVLVSSVAGSRPTSSQRSSTQLELARQLVESGDQVEMVEVLAASRIVFFSPLPPIISGMWSRKRGLAIASSVRYYLPRERRPLTLEHRQDDLQRLVEPLEPVGEGAELETELVVLELEPAGADAEHAPGRR